MNNLIFGYIGSFLLIISLLPQVIKTYKIKNVKALSIPFILLQILTCCFMLTYTSLNKDYPLIIANICLLIQFTFLLILIYLYSRKPPHIKLKVSYV